jgi:alkylation response protein AidB-like acyl-CoA dehydrogenase
VAPETEGKVEKTMILTPQQQEIQRLAREFTEKNIIPVAGEYDRSGEFPEFIIHKAKEAGLLDMAIPKQFGGRGLDAVTQGIVLEEIGYGCAGFATIIGVSILGFCPVMLAGTDEQKKFYLEPVLQGGLAAFALTEPGAGSDVGAAKTTAKREGDEYILNGSKCFITSGGYARVFTIFALTDPTKGVRGLSAFLVKAGQPGLIVAKHENKLGIRGSNTVELLIQDLRVPVSQLLGKEGDGMKIAMGSLDITRPMIGAQSVGIAQRALDECLKYFQNKYPDPRKLGQAAQFRLADMRIQIEAARQTVRHALAVRDAGLPYTVESAIAKTMGSDTAMRVATDALELLGAHGYSHDCVVEKLVRDAKIQQIYEGTNQVQRLVIAGQLMASIQPQAQAAKAGR